MRKFMIVLLVLAVSAVYTAGFAFAAETDEGGGKPKAAESQPAKHKKKKKKPVAKKAAPKENDKKAVAVKTGPDGEKSASKAKALSDATGDAKKEARKTENSQVGDAAKKTVVKTEDGSGKPVGKAAKANKNQKKKGKKGQSGKVTVLPPSDWSPNNFPAGRRGWCTWYADGRFSKYHGEKLELNPRPNSNAYTWYSRAQNVVKTSDGAPGDIMVIRRGKGDATGHVAFVEECVPGESWTVTHSNFDFGGHQPLKVELIDGRKVFTDVFVPGPRPGTVKLKGGNSVYNLLGFLHVEVPEAPEDFSVAAAGSDYFPDDLSILAEAQGGVEQRADAEKRLEEVASIGDEQSPLDLLKEPDTCGCTILPKISL